MYRENSTAMRQLLKKWVQVACIAAVAAGMAPQVAEAATRKKAEPKRVHRVYAGNGKRTRMVAAVIPAKPSFGQLAGLGGGTDQLGLRSNVALVMDQDTREVLFSKND